MGHLLVITVHLKCMRVCDFLLLEEKSVMCVCVNVNVFVCV